MRKYSETTAGYGTVIIDYLTLRKAIRGKLVVDGSLDVSSNALFQSNVFINENLDVIKDVFSNALYTNDIYTTNLIAEGNILVKGDRLTAYHTVDICGNLTVYDHIIFGNTHAYLYSTNNQNVGINTESATSTLDINGENARSLNVYSSKPTNFNIIARNNTNNGIAVFSNTTTSYIGFYNNHSISESDISANAMKPDAKIQYTSSGVLSIDVSKNTNLFSRVSITPGATHPVDHLLEETLVTYGSAGIKSYLWNSLENNSMKTSSTSTFVSYDNSTNTFINVITPNKKGVSIGGGSYINDSSRSFGTVGLLNAKGDYYPALNIVSGNSTIKQKFTVGINTHSPSVDKYTVDVNGPIKLTNGETTVSYRANSQIISMGFSRINTNIGIAVGAPYLLPSGSTSNPLLQVNNNHKIAYTIDGGSSWNTIIQDDPVLSSSKKYFRDVYSYDNILNIWVGDDSIIYCNYTTPQLITFYTVSPSLDFSKISYSSVFINNSRRVFVSDTQNEIYYFDVSNNDNYTQFYVDFFKNISVNVKALDTNINPTSISSIIQIRGFQNKLYVIGSINRLQVWKNINSDSPTLDTSTYRLIPAETYNSIYVYDDDTAVVVGKNVISYTNNGGTNWVDASVNIPNDYALNSVHMYSPDMSIAVGDNGLILSSMDGNKTWNIMSPTVLASSGNSGLLIDPSYNLTNVAITDKNTFLITKTVNEYNTSNINGIKTTGNTSIFYCNYPYIFNNPHNYVLDVFGSSRYSGDINVIDGGRIQSTNDSFYMINKNVKSIYFGNEANTVSIGNPTNSMVTHNYDFTVLHDASFNGNVSVDRDATITGNVLMRSKLRVFGDVSFNSNLQVDKTVWFNDRLYVQDDVSMNKNLFVAKNTVIGGEVSVGGNTRISRRLNVDGDVSFNSNLQVDKTVWLNDLLYVQKDVSMNSSLFVAKNTVIGGEVSIGSELSVGGNVQLSRKLMVSGDVSFNSNLQVDKTVWLNDLLYVQKDVSMNSSLFVAKNTVVRGEFSVGGNVQLSRKLMVSGDVSFNSNLQVDKIARFNDRLYVQNDVLFNSNLQVDKTVWLNDLLYVQKDVSMNSSLFVSKDTVMGGKLSVGENVQFGKTLNVTDDVTFNSGLQVDNSVVINNKLTVQKDVQMNANLTVENDTFLNGRLFIKGNIKLMEGISVDGDVSFNSKFYVNKSTYLNDRLYVQNDVSMNASLSVAQNTVLNGRTTFNGNVVFVQPLRVGSDAIFVKNVEVNQNTNLKSRLYVQDDVSMNSNLFVMKNTVLNGEAFVNGNAQFFQRMRVSDDVSFNSNLQVDKTAWFNDRLYVQNDVSMNANLFVAKDTILNGKTTFNGIVQFVQPLSVISDSVFTANVTVNKIAYLNDRLYVTNDVSMNATLFVAKNTVLNGEAFVNGNAQFSQRMRVSGDVSFNSNLQVDKTAWFNDRLYVQKDVSMNSNLFIAKNTVLNGETFVNGNAQFSQRLRVVGDVSFNSTLQVNNVTSLNDRLYVQKDVFMSANLYVTKDASFNANVTIRNILRARTYEGADPSNIFIGSVGLYTSNGAYAPQRNIYIGTDNNIYRQKNTKNVITIGGGDDTIVIGGKGITIQNINVGKTITINNGLGSSIGAGVVIADGTNSTAGSILVSSDKNGYSFKAPGQTSIVTLDISAVGIPMNTPNLQITNGILTVSRGNTFDSSKNYTIGAGQIDISNVLLKKYSAKDSLSNIQNIDTNLGVNGNIYARRGMAIGKSVISPNTPNTVLDINGYLAHNNGYIWQF